MSPTTTDILKSTHVLSIENFNMEENYAKIILQIVKVLPLFT